MAGIEKENRPDHRFKFNGVENEQTFGLNWNETLFRTYDLQLGRWHQVDPEIDILEFQAPYVGLNNTPVMITDPDGDIGWLGAIIGGAVGFVYGVVKHGFKKGGWKKVIATTVGGAVAGATLNAGLGMATSAGLTGANMAYAVGASSIASVITGNLAEQGVNNLLGSQNGFNKQDFMASLVVSVPAAIVGPAAGAGGEKILKNITTKVTKKLTSNTSFQARKEFVKKQAKLLRRKAAQKGTPITSKQAKLAAEKMFDRVRRDKLEKGSKMWIDFTTKSVQIGTASTNKIFQDRMKVSQKKKD